MDTAGTARRMYISDGTASNAYGVGWQLLKANLWPMILIALIYLILDVPVSAAASSGLFFIPPFSDGIFDLLIYGPVGMSTAWVFLKAARNEEFSIGDMFAVFPRNYGWAILGYLVQMALILLGLLFLIVPGIIIGVRLSFMSYLIIDRKMGPIEAMQASWDMTHGYGWTIFALGILAIPIALLGILCLGVGLIPAVAWIYCAEAVLYLTVSREKTPIAAALEAPEM